MKLLFVLSCVIAAVFAKPGLLLHNLSYAPVVAAVVPGAPLGPDGRVTDTPAVALAKAEHAAAHINERLNLDREALRSADYVVSVAAAPFAYPSFVPDGAILATDPRPLDTPEVALAKAAHANVHAYETARNLAAA